MKMAPAIRKLALATHLIVSVGWIGAALVYLALGFAAASSDSPAVVRAAWIAMELSGWWVIVPLAVASLLTGLVMALGTRWGLFRHYWVLLSFFLTVFAVVILLLHMPGVSAIAAMARDADAAALRGLGGDLAHPGIGLLVLIAVLVLNVYKPTGLTRRGRRVRREAGPGE